MPSRLKRFHNSGQTHFITFSCYLRHPLFTSNGANQIFEDALERVRLSYKLSVYGYVIMPEHVHLLISEPEEKPLAEAIKSLKQGVSRRLLHSRAGESEDEGESKGESESEGEGEGAPFKPSSGLSGGSDSSGGNSSSGGNGSSGVNPEHFWQKRYYDHNVRTHTQFVEKLRYIHRNPVKRGLCEHAEDWEWSSFRHDATGAEGPVQTESEWTARTRTEPQEPSGQQSNNPLSQHKP